MSRTDRVPEGLRVEATVLLLLGRPQPSPESVERCRELLTRHRDAFDWGFLLDQGARHRVLALVAHNLSRHRLYHAADSTPLTPYPWLFPGIHAANRSRYYAMADGFAEVFRALGRDGLRFAVRKGPVLAEHVYGDPGLRPMFDLDLLVERRDAGRVGTVLGALGYAQGRLADHGSRIEAFSRNTRAYWRLNVSNLLPYLKLSHRSEFQAFVVDVCLNPFYRPDGAASAGAAGDDALVRAVLDRAVDVTVCGEPVRALSTADRLVDLCAHFTKEATALFYVERGNDLRLLKFLDIALACEALGDGPAWSAVLDRVRECRVERSVYFALHHVEVVYPGSVPASALAALRPADTAYLEEYGAVDHQPARWREPLLDRLFDSARRSTATGRSTIPVR